MHPSADVSVDISVDISTNTRPMYLWSIYRPSVGRYVDRDVSVDVSTNVSTERSSDGRHIDSLLADISVDIAADTRPIHRPLIVSGISVNRWWYIGQKLRLLVYKLYAFHPFWSTSKISEGFIFSLRVPQIQLLSSKTLK